MSKHKNSTLPLNEYGEPIKPIFVVHIPLPIMQDGQPNVSYFENTKKMFLEHEIARSYYILALPVIGIKQAEYTAMPPFQFLKKEKLQALEKTIDDALAQMLNIYQNVIESLHSDAEAQAADSLKDITEKAEKVNERINNLQISKGGAIDDGED